MHLDRQIARLLVVDDHELMRIAIRTIINKDDALEVVGEARDGAEGVRRCRELRPNMVLMDIAMPRMDGIEATRRIKAEFPLISVLVLTAHADQELLMRAIMAGAAGYILKGEHPNGVLDAVHAVIDGETRLDQGLAMHLLRTIAEDTATGAPFEAVPSSVAGHGAYSPNPLTRREIEVLGHVLRGRTNSQIAAELHISLSTVKRHIEHILAKLRVSDRTQAALKAVELGLFP